jgi:hypothetical protein
MANTISRCYGHDSNRTKNASRLGSRASSGEANTWRTFTTCYVEADGSGYVMVKRDGVVIHRYEFPAEGSRYGQA